MAPSSPKLGAACSVRLVESGTLTAWVITLLVSYGGRRQRDAYSVRSFFAWTYVVIVLQSALSPLVCVSRQNSSSTSHPLFSEQTKTPTPTTKEQEQKQEHDQEQQQQGQHQQHDNHNHNNNTTTTQQHTTTHHNNNRKWSGTEC